MSTPYPFLYYLQTNLICMLVLGIILFVQQRKTFARTTGKMYYFRLILLTMLYCVSDCVCWYVDYKTFEGARILNIVSNIVYIMLPLPVCANWHMYVLSRMEDKSLEGPKKMFYFLPVTILSILVILTPVANDFAFSVSSDNIYERGIGAYLVPAVSWIYLLITTIRIIRESFKEENRFKRDEYLPLAYFAIPTAIASVAQVLLFGTTFNQIGFTIAIALVYIEDQNNQISVDELTGLNNRRELNKYLEGRFCTADKNDEIFLCMIDVDHFKSINDTYGHVEGDEALRSVAQILKRACANNPSRLFLSRYGGDEFVISGVNRSDEEIKKLLADIEEETKKENASGNKMYMLVLSAGVTKGTIGSFKSHTVLIDAADDAMYDVKKNKKR